MTTHVMDNRTNMRGTLVRLVHGQPSVRWFGDQTEYRPSWDRVDVVSSDEYLLPRDGFQHELWVSANGDVWRRRVLESAWPCQPGMHHSVREGARLCEHCDADSHDWIAVELFVLVAAQGVPADHAARTALMPSGPRPQSRADVEEFAGELLPVGSPEAHARSVSLSEPTKDSPGCWLRGGVGALSALVLLVVLLAVWRLAIG
jgi:hypothetical protein